MNIFKSRHHNRTATPAAHDERSRATHGKAADQLRDPLTSVLMSAMR